MQPIHPDPAGITPTTGHPGCAHPFDQGRHLGDRVGGQRDRHEETSTWLVGPGP